MSAAAAAAPSLKEMMLERLSTGLKRKSLTFSEHGCSKWAEYYRMMPSGGNSSSSSSSGAWRFDEFPWLKGMHDADNELCVGQKAAQMGFTEMCLNRCFYAIDVEGQSVLYVLPTEGDASDFSTSRFDPALELSDHLQGLFSDVKNIGHKRAGGCSLFVRGSKSKSKLKSLPCGRMFFDEVDEMNQDNIVLAFERMSGQTSRQAWMISTPTIDGKGINRYFQDSTQEHFFFKCPHCGKHTELIFPDCLVITAETPNDVAIKDTHIICKECKGVLPHASKTELFKKGEWVPSSASSLTRGFHINQLYSCRLDPWKIGQLWLSAQTNPTDEQEFYNSKMGQTHAVEGAQLNEKDIERALGGYQTYHEPPKGAFMTMGVDVGTQLHYEITQYKFRKSHETNDINLLTDCRVLRAGKLRDFEDLDALMNKFNIIMCVIDNQPDTRKSMEFANRFPGRVYLCIYVAGLASKNIRIHEEMENKVTVDRTAWLDVSLGRFRNNSIKIPVDICREYRDQLQAPVRVYKRDRDGNPYGKYEHVKDDHFAHARNYSEIALQLGAVNSRSQDMELEL